MQCGLNCLLGALIKQSTKGLADLPALPLTHAEHPSVPFLVSPALRGRLDGCIYIVPDPASLQQSNGSHALHSRWPLLWNRVQALPHQIHKLLGRFLGDTAHSRDTSATLTARSALHLSGSEAAIAGRVNAGLMSPSLSIYTPVAMQQSWDLCCSART